MLVAPFSQTGLASQMTGKACPRTGRVLERQGQKGRGHRDTSLNVPCKSCNDELEAVKLSAIRNTNALPDECSLHFNTCPFLQ